MRLAYLTTDEVNEALAQRMADDCGVALEPRVPKQGPPDAGYDAVLIDWDHWPLDQRAELLARLCDGLPPWRVAVHGYTLEDGLAAALRAGGVVVHRHLLPEMIRLLQDALVPAGASAALAGGRNRRDAGDHSGCPPAPLAGIGP